MNLRGNLTRFDKPIQSNPALCQAWLLAMAARTSQPQAVLCDLVSALPIPASCISRISCTSCIFLASNSFKMFQAHLQSVLKSISCITMLTLSHILQACAVPRSAPALRASNPWIKSLCLSPSPSEFPDKQIQTRPREDTMICYDQELLVCLGPSKPAMA